MLKDEFLYSLTCVNQLLQWFIKLNHERVDLPKTCFIFKNDTDSYAPSSLQNEQLIRHLLSRVFYFRKQREKRIKKKKKLYD